MIKLNGAIMNELFNMYMELLKEGNYNDIVFQEVKQHLMNNYDGEIYDLVDELKIDFYEVIEEIMYQTESKINFNI